MFKISLFLIILATALPVRACEVALALTVDVSGSINHEEYRLQMDGLAAALQDSTVENAMVDGQVALMLVQWSGGTRQAVSIPWRRIHSKSDVTTFAAEVIAAPRKWQQFSTGIGNALRFTADQFGPVADCGKKVIDVSGDGYSNEGDDPKLVARELADNGFQVNGLAIETDAFELTEYYRHNVIGGLGAFVLTAASYEDYPRAILRKLLTELVVPIS